MSGKGEEKTITVEYVDYGTKEPVNEVWELDHTYITLHAALVKNVQQTFVTNFHTFTKGVVCTDHLNVLCVHVIIM